MDRTFDINGCPKTELDSILGGDISSLAFGTDSCFGETAGEGDGGVAGHGSTTGVGGRGWGGTSYTFVKKQKIHSKIG